ncbi:SDR family NAD(P)-dependent oxidoreductase [Nocardioides mangrovi]|uniref:SDR family oxidoreductase n=1 Tax=Nocardioides mangrovi TaxID=2874580 RepID=A0ABS7UBQ7_9ACTN|nr:SDR family oxidoreductase [Nocardioides mangrovi]MBZ5738443.1 SDR family oxidoreductase [Nocardioides mangrovi]
MTTATDGRFTGTGVLVTGAASGIGRRIGERFAAEGARVVCLDRVVPHATDHLACAVVADVGDESSVAAAFDDAAATVGGLSVVVHCAGIHHLAPLTATSVEAWQRVNDVNALGTFLVTRAAGAHMIARGDGGRVVNIASMAAKQGGAHEAAYAASKAAVVALSRVAALEWGPHGITVNAVCPGYVPTEMGADSRTEEDVRRWSSLSPLGRLGTPDDVAGLVLFLASAEGAYLTGQALNVTGGMAMH